MSDRDFTPIAYAWRNWKREWCIAADENAQHLLVAGKTHDTRILRRLPSVAVPLVAATEVNEALAEVDYLRWLLAEANYERELTENIAETYRAEMVRQAPSTPTVGSPESLRHAAETLAQERDNHCLQVAVERAIYDAIEYCLNLAEALEREVADAATEREARINATVTALSDWEERNETERSLSQIAAALDDLGYRLDTSQADQ